jgi:hypothetical protein
MRSVKNQLRRLAKSDGFLHENQSMLIALGPKFVEELDRHLKKSIREGEEEVDIELVARAAFGTAFADYLTTKEMIECLNSHLLNEGGNFYEMARWHIILNKSEIIKDYSEYYHDEQWLEVAYCE